MKGKRAERRILSAATLLTVLFLGLILVFFYRWYHIELEHDIIVWKNSATKTGTSIEDYIRSVKNTFAYSSDHLNTMLKMDSTNEQLLRYMSEESNMIITSRDGNMQGLYGYINGEYLDGEGWVPEPGYDPTKRPWYTEVQGTDGEVVLINPYDDMSSEYMVVTLSRILADGKSVAAMDLYLNKIDDFIEESIYDSSVGEALIISEDGYVIVDSLNQYGGQQLTPLLSLVAERNVEDGFFIDDVRNSYLNAGDNSYLYIDEVSEGWYLIIAIKTAAAQRNKIETQRFAVITVVLFIAIIVLWVYSIDRKNKESIAIDMELASLAELYLSVHMLDLIKGQATAIKTNERIEAVVNNVTDLSEMSLFDVMQKLTAVPFMERMQEFTNLETLSARLKDKNAISMEFIGAKTNEWCRARFIVVRRLESGKVRSCLWTTESIHAEKEEEQRLKLLSERDLLTGIYNRGSGEKRVREGIEQDSEGAFLLLDADHFKCINDTYGHDVGDKVLIQLAEALKSSCRGSDLAMRMGGDEFAVFLNGQISQTQVDAYIQRLFKKIDTISVPEMNGKTVSVSVGVSFKVSGDDKTFVDLYKEADKKTYESKKAEGNQVTY